MLNKLFPPKWRLRIFVLEAILLSITLISVGKVMSKATDVNSEDSALSADGAIDIGKMSQMVADEGIGYGAAQVEQLQNVANITLNQSQKLPED